VNFLAHLEVARRRLGGNESAVLLGAMLPDLISVASLRVGPLERWPTGVADGIRCHRRADEAFHADDRFVTGITAIREDLTARGFARGPARAAAHVSWELLLDGTLLTAETTRDAYGRALATPGPEWVPAAEPDELARWQELVGRYREWGLPTAIEPAGTAERVVDLLSRRPRLAIDRSRTAALAEVLVAHRPGVAAAATAVIDATAASGASRSE
jgi:hypothetical protein